MFTGNGLPVAESRRGCREREDRYALELGGWSDQGPAMAGCDTV